MTTPPLAAIGHEHLGVGTTIATLKPYRQRLFIDLDGVGADFDQGYHDKFGHWPWEVDDDTMWDNIASVPDFFATLPVMPGFIEAITEFVEEGYDLAFLTACPNNNYRRVADQKYQWVHNNVPHDILTLPVVSGKNKARFVQHDGDLLVDDFEKNLHPWAEAGGIPILHKNWEASKAQVHMWMRIGRGEPARIENPAPGAGA